MDEQTKSIKSIMVLNIIIASIVVVIFGLQVFQVATRFDVSSFEKLQEQLNKIATTTKSIIPSQQQMMPQGGAQQSTGGAGGGKCGDGTCDTVEKANPTLCPTDCK